jgi:hydroxyethylthiazole kinase
MIDAATALTRLRERRPLVQNITNYVAMDVSANVLLALGASPAMVHAAEEAADFTSISDALVVNIGTLSPPWVQAMHLAAERANTLGKPWVLDPVGAGATPYRTQVAVDLLRRQPTIVRGNAAEIMALGGAAGTRQQGVDSRETADQASDTAMSIARTFGVVVSVTGPVDLITNGSSTYRVANGHFLMPMVTGLGCAVSAVTAAFAATEPDPVMAATAALAVYGLAGERAADGAQGPGTLRARLMDALYLLSPADVAQGARIVAV